MKSMNNNDHNNANNHNWLGFSLSPNMKLEVTSGPPHPSHHQPRHSSSATSSVSNSVPPTFYLSHSSLNGSGLCYGVAENGACHSSLAVMPIKSDGSLCLAEALTRSHSEAIVPHTSPKLEDFLGGASLGTHEYESHNREAMALSLDSIYYNNLNTEHQPTRDHFLDLPLEPFRPQDHMTLQSHTYYTGLPCQSIYETPLGQETKETNVTMGESQMPQNWVTRQYSSPQAVELQMNGHVGEGVASGSVGAVGCGDLQSLSLSMSPGSQSSCVTAPTQISPTGTESLTMDAKKRGPGKIAQKQPVHRKSIDTFGQRTSQFRGVTRHRWTGRYEAHLWDNSCKKEGQTRKGRQVYLGGYDMEEKAARAYDLAALKYWGPSTHINFPLENYQAELEEMKNMTRQEYVAHLRRKSSGFSRGASMYRGVTRHHQHGRWQARIGRVAGNKDLYLGTFSTQEEAAEAYDIAAIKFRGVNAVTNFDISRYDVERIMASNTLLAGEMARRNKGTSNESRTEAIEHYNPSTLAKGEAILQPVGDENGSDWKMVLYHSPQHHHQPSRGCDQKSTSSYGNYRNNPSMSMSLQDLIGIDSVNPSPGGQQQVGDDTAKIGAHFSNPSSLVTSLSSSREASPDKTGPTMIFPKQPPPQTVSKIASPVVAAGVTSWFPSAAAAQLRPAAALSMSHLPVFAAWNDT